MARCLLSAAVSRVIECGLPPALEASGAYRWRICEQERSAISRLLRAFGTKHRYCVEKRVGMRNVGESPFAGTYAPFKQYQIVVLAKFLAQVL
jgi:hypothetical protein